jgi:hypothetical protein
MRKIKKINTPATINQMPELAARVKMVRRRRASSS